MSAFHEALLRLLVLRTARAARCLPDGYRRLLWGVGTPTTYPLQGFSRRIVNRELIFTECIFQGRYRLTRAGPILP